MAPERRSERASFEGHDGASLDARLELPAGDSEPRAWALFAHCFTCGKDVKAASTISRSLAEAGIAVLRFDFTGLGSSDGDFANTNFSSNVDDLLCAAGWLEREQSAPDLLIGHSLGGAAVLAAALELDHDLAVATIAAPSEPAHVLGLIGESRERIEREGEATVSLAGREFTIKRQFLEDLERRRPLERLASLGEPLLIFHSPVDQTVGIDNAREIYDAAKHPKSFVSLDSADHLLSNRDDSMYVARVLSAWATRYLEG